MSATPLPALLVVDDEPDLLDFVARALRRRFAVTTCGDPEQAFTLAERGRFDVLLTDQTMPRLSGLELLARLAGRHPEMTRVLLSGYIEAPEIAAALANGVLDGHAVKPIDSETLVEVIERARAGRRGRASGVG